MPFVNSALLNMRNFSIKCGSGANGASDINIAAIANGNNGILSIYLSIFKITL